MIENETKTVAKQQTLTVMLKTTPTHIPVGGTAWRKALPCRTMLSGGTSLVEQACRLGCVLPVTTPLAAINFLVSAVVSEQKKGDVESVVIYHPTYRKTTIFVQSLEKLPPVSSSDHLLLPEAQKGFLKRRILLIFSSFRTDFKSRGAHHSIATGNCKTGTRVREYPQEPSDVWQRTVTMATRRRAGNEPI